MTEQDLAELDAAVAKADPSLAFAYTETIGYEHGFSYSPTRDYAEALKLLEKHRLTVGPGVPKPSRENERYWLVTDDLDRIEPTEGDAPTIAICRAVVELAKASS